MPAVTQRQPRPERTPAARRAAVPRAAPRRRRQPRVANGVVWIVLVAGLLAGVVAMNVAVLRLNLKMDNLVREEAKLRADNAGLSSRLSSADASARLQNLAQSQLHLVPAASDQTAYIQLARP